MQTILFVCSGNTCRSPMAEAIARHVLSRGGDEAGQPFVASAGIGTAGGLPISGETIAALRRLGIDEPHGTSKPLTAAMIRNADLVLCMTREHVEAARSLVADTPSVGSRIRPVDPRGDIEDPIGAGQAAYDAVARRLMKVIPLRLREFQSHANRDRLRPPRL